LSSEVPSDLTVETGGTRFAVHKAPLVSKCGRIRRMFADIADEDQLFYLIFPDLPGGAEAFELVAKFCYGLDPSISIYNVAMIRCAAEYLEMKECGLDSLAETYFNQVVLLNPANSVAVLRTCDTLLPLADDLEIVNKCIEKIVSAASGELMSSGWNPEEQKGMESSWVQIFSEVNMDFFQRIVSGMKSKGVQEDIISGALIHYAHNSLDGMSKKQRQQRSVVEGIVGLLPPGKNAAPISFLSGLLRTAITVDASAQCRMELESRLAMNLDRATSHDLLVLSFSHTGDELFDVDVVQRVVTNFLAFALDEAVAMYGSDEAEELGTYYNNNGIAMEKVSTLMDSYLAEIAPDQSLTVSKFILLAEAVGEKGRLLDDGLYRAIDICLKVRFLFLYSSLLLFYIKTNENNCVGMNVQAHPSATDGERNKLCKLMDCQKLSADACMHAAKNQRLPLHVVVQVLYFEQLRLRDVMQSGSVNECGIDLRPSQVMSKGFLSARSSSRDGYESVRVENRELKFEFCRMRMRMRDLEKECVRMNQIMVRPRYPNHLLRSLSKNLIKCQSFFREGIRIILFSKTSHHRRRRHRGDENITVTTFSNSSNLSLKGD
ncbi:hypothetical protein KI387_002501, partial [Taxus chinensis]